MVSFSNLVVIVATSLLSVGITAAPTSSQAQRVAIAPIRREGGAPITAGSGNIKYTLGAPVITAPLNVYYIYYGTFSTAQRSILEDYARGLGASAWYGITKKYYFQQSSTSPQVLVNGQVNLARTVNNNYSLGKSLTGSALPNIIQAQIDSGALPTDTNGLYLVLTSGDVYESIRPDLGTASFCKDYCGYHVSTKLRSGTRVYYAMVGNPTRCLSGCTSPSNLKVSPNGDLGVDSMISTISHEISEAVTDPWSDGIRAWQDAIGYENGDKCSYNYGATSKTATGATYNVNWSGRNFLVQQMWDRVSQSCRLTV